MGNGEDSGTWGSITNTNWNLIEQAVSGAQTITMSNADYTLSNLNGVSDEARNMVLVVQGTNSGIYQVIIPANQTKMYVIYNNTTGGYAITIGTTGVGGTLISVPNGVTAQVYTDGTNTYSAQTGSAGPFTVNGTLTSTGLTDTGNMSVGGTLSVSGAASLATGSISGIMTAPTASAGTNTTQIATTAFASNAVTALSSTLGTMSTQNANNVAITAGSISGLYPPIPVASGGTGTGSLSQNYVLLGNGTSSVQAIAPGSSGNVLTSNGTTWLSQKPLSVYSSGNVAFSNGANWNSGKTGFIAFGMNFICTSANNGYAVGDLLAASSSDGDAARQTSVYNTGSYIFYTYAAGLPSYATTTGARFTPNSSEWAFQFWVLA